MKTPPFADGRHRHQTTAPTDSGAPQAGASANGSSVVPSPTNARLSTAHQLPPGMPIGRVRTAPPKAGGAKRQRLDLSGSSLTRATSGSSPTQVPLRASPPVVFQKGDILLRIPPVSFATPMTDKEYEWLTLAMPQNKIFQAEEIDTFKSGSYRIRCHGTLPEKKSAWAATWMVDASLKPANLTLQVANEQGVQQMELRCEPLRTNADWLKTLELKLSTSDRSKAKTCLEALETDGPTLEEIDLENRSTECLQALLKSMASRQDEVGARVRDALKDKKATPAQLQSLERDDLTKLLLQACGSSQYFPLNVSDLRWLPPVVVGRFIERKWGKSDANAPVRTQMRKFLSEVLKASAPVGNGRVWPSSFVGGAKKPAGRPQSYTLNWLLDAYEAFSTSPHHRQAAAAFLKSLEQHYSVVDFPQIAHANVSEDRLIELEIAPTTRKLLLLDNGFLGWLKSQGLQALQAACERGGLSGRARRAPEPRRPLSDPTLQAAEARAVAWAEKQMEPGTPVESKVTHLHNSYIGALQDLEMSSLQEILAKSPQHQVTLKALPANIGAIAASILEADQRRKDEGIRAQVLSDLEDLPLLAQECVMQALAELGTRHDVARMRGVFNRFHGMQSHGSRFVSNYRSPFKAHRDLLHLAEKDNAENLGPSSSGRKVRQLPALFEHFDKHWTPGQLLFVQWVEAIVRRKAQAGPRKLRAELQRQIDATGFERFISQHALPWLLKTFGGKVGGAGGSSGPSQADKDLLLADHASWIKQVDDRLREEGHDPKLAVKVMQAWMQAQESRITNPFVSPVFRSLKAHASLPEDFLASVDADLAQWDAEIEQARTRGEASPARATIERAFTILHSIANVEPEAEPPQAAPEAGPGSSTAGPSDGLASGSPLDQDDHTARDDLQFPYDAAWEASVLKFFETLHLGPDGFQAERLC